MIKFEDISFSYRERRVLSGIDFSLEPGKLTVVIGPNGSGKTTLLKLAAGILKPESGRLWIDGEEIQTLSPRRLAQQVSYMAQSRNTPNIIARRMVLHGRFPYLSYPRRYSKADFEICRQALEAAAALDIAQRPMTELSGGQRQRIYLAMTLAQGSANVLMDEPMSFLDVHYQLELARLAKELSRQGKAVLMVMHDLRLALQIADRLALVSDGRLRCFDSPQAAFASGDLDRAFKISLSMAETENGPQYYYQEI